MMLNDADDTNFTSDEIVGDFFKELHDDGSSKSGINNIVDDFYKESHEVYHMNINYIYYVYKQSLHVLFVVYSTYRSYLIRKI